MIKKETRKRLLFCSGVGAMSRAAAGGLGFRAAKSPHQKKRDILSDVSFLLSMGYKKDIFAVFAYEFELSHKK